MQNFDYQTPTRLIFGKGVVDEKLKEVMGGFGKKVLLTYGGGSIKKLGLYDKVKELLKEKEIYELSGIQPNPKYDPSVLDGVKICKENDIDVILAVGGGSVLDCSKAIATGAKYDGDPWDLISYKAFATDAIPIVDIITLAATGSEYDPGGVISRTDTNDKIGYVDLHNFPRVSFLDPTYTFSVSKYQTAAGSADIMSHIMEGYFCSVGDSELSEGIAETILKTVIRNLPIVLKEPDNYTARANLMHCESVACSGIPEYGKPYTGWPCHVLEHELSAYYDITHGVGLAILTPRWMRYILKKDPSCKWRFVRFARNVWGLEEEDEEKLAWQSIDVLEQFFKDSGIPMHLRELNIDEKNFEAMADHACEGGRLQMGLVPLTKEDVIEIFKDCL